MHHADNFDTGVDAGSHDTALKRAEPGRPGRGRVRSLAPRGLAGLLAALVALPLQAQAQTASTDATLSGLEILGAPDGETIALIPVFDAATGAYTAMVANRIDAVTLTATKNDNTATVAITRDDNTNTPDEAVLSLTVGANTLTVTSADTTTTQTYTSTVARAAAPPAPTDCPADTAWCATLGVCFADVSPNNFIKTEIWGYRRDASYGDLSPVTFSHGGTSYTVAFLYRLNSTAGGITVGDQLNLDVGRLDLPDGTVLQLGSRTFTVDTVSDTGTPGLEEWDLQANPLDWTAEQHVTASLKFPPPPAPVTGVTGVTVAAGDMELVVEWTAVDTATVYTVQWKSDSGATRVTVTSGSTTRYTIRGLTNDTEYTVRVIANRTGASDIPSSEVTGTPEPPLPAQQQAALAPLAARFVSVPPEHDGATEFWLELTFDAPVAKGSRRHIRALLGATGGTVTRLRRKDGRLDHWEVRVEPSSHGAITVSLAASPACGETGAVCTPDGRTFTTALATRIQGPPGLTVADAAVQEAANATLAFAVTLSRAASGTVTVDYATTDASAQAGVDYTATRGTLTFQTGESSKTITVAVLDDVHDEGEETLTLTLANAAGAYLADGTATGRIRNTDPLPQALMARFGRTAAVHVVERIEARMAAPRAVGAEAQVAGRQVRPGMERELALDVLRQLGASAGAPAPGAGTGGARSGSPLGAAGGSMSLGAGMGRPVGGAMGLATGPMDGMAGPAGGLFDGGLASMGLGGGNLFTGSSFAVTRETRQGGLLSFWSRAAQSSFAGRERTLGLDGDVRTTMIGADYAKGPMVVGLSLAHSRGQGGYHGRSAGSSGHVASSVTGLYQWLGYTVSDRVSVWGVTGYGKGALTLTPGEAPALRSGQSMAMAAGGMRGELAASVVAGFGLAFKADALWVGTAIDGVQGAPEGIWRRPRRR